MHKTSQATQHWHDHVEAARPARRSTAMVSRRRKAMPLLEGFGFLGMEDPLGSLLVTSVLERP